MDLKREQPIYKQLEVYFMDKIQSGEWPVHTKIKDEITLAAELNVSRGTLRKALKHLIGKGLLVQKKGKGTFVVSNHIEQPLATRLISFSEAMEEKSLEYKTLVLNKQQMNPDIKVAAFLEMPVSEKVIYIERVRLVDNIPVIYLKNYLPFSMCPGLMEDDLEKQTLFSLLEKKYSHSIQWGRRYFKAIPAIGEASFNLGVQQGSAVLYLEQVVYTDDKKPLEYSNLWINSDRFDIVSILHR